MRVIFSSDLGITECEDEIEVLADSHRARFLGLLCKKLWGRRTGIRVSSELIHGSPCRGTHDSAFWAVFDILK